MRLVPLRVGTRPIGLLAVAGRVVEAGTLDTLAGVAAIAIERAQLLAERQEGEMARQSDQLKSALLASISHDLRTPLTAIRVAASNVDAPVLTPAERAEQRDVILAEVERLTRLFENLLEMARIDAGAVERTERWAHPSEIVAAARAQVEHVLSQPPRRRPPGTRRARAARPSADRGSPGPPARERRAVHCARVDDRGSGADRCRTGSEWTCAITDRASARPTCRTCSSASIAARWRRIGPRAPAWDSAIVRGLVAAAGGRVWAENAPDGGAVFTMAVPADVRAGSPEPADV